VSELSPEEKQQLKVNVELTLEDIEYLEDAVHSHKILHEHSLSLSKEPVPWEMHLAILKIAYEGKERAELVHANLRAMGHALKEGKTAEWTSPISSKE
jgi:hypothetical protein